MVASASLRGRRRAGPGALRLSMQDRQTNDLRQWTGAKGKAAGAGRPAIGSRWCEGRRRLAPRPRPTSSVAPPAWTHGPACRHPARRHADPAKVCARLLAPRFELAERASAFAPERAWPESRRRAAIPGMPIRKARPPGSRRRGSPWHHGCTRSEGPAACRARRNRHRHGHLPRARGAVRAPRPCRAPGRYSRPQALTPTAFSRLGQGLTGHAITARHGHRAAHCSPPGRMFPRPGPSRAWCC